MAQRNRNRETAILSNADNELAQAFELVWLEYADAGLDKKTAFDLFCLGVTYATERLTRG